MDKKLLKTAEKELNKKIDITKSFQENNFDSMDLMIFLSIYEDHYKIKLNEADYKKVKNFSSLNKFIKNSDS